MSDSTSRWLYSEQHDTLSSRSLECYWSIWFRRVMLGLSHSILLYLSPSVTPTRKPTRLWLHAAQSDHVFEDSLRGNPLHVDQFQQKIKTFEFPEKKSLEPNPESIRPRTKAWTAVLVITSSIPICCSYQQIYLYLIFAQIVRVMSMP